MLVIPAIDIRNGNCVRLLQGDPDKETVYSSSPVEMARKFEKQGAGLIHVVDLDGAFEGRAVNFDLVCEIASSVDIPIEIGGGVRTIEELKKYLENGIQRIVLGTVIMQDEFSSFIEKYQENIVAGVDARDSKVATHGWKNVSEVKAVDFIKELNNRGIKEFIYTDISTDGMLEGPNYRALEEILDTVPGISLVASGGVSTLSDVEKLTVLSDKGLKGCIIGKAIYDGRIDLKEAIARV